jgi:hypothetical protein
MLIVRDTDAHQRFAEAILYALQAGLLDQFLGQLQYLSGYANGAGCSQDRQQGFNTRCILYRDFAPLSFTFVMQRLKRPAAQGVRTHLMMTPAEHVAYCTEDRNWNHWFNGGLIYQGPSQPADGSAPSLTVSIDPTKHGWFVHT